jgi:hypothetical protein
MKKITVPLTVEELQALVTLTENQFFRMKFLDPKMPGYKARPDELKAAQSAVAVIRKVLDKEKGYKGTEQGSLKAHQLILKRTPSGA